jgi:hypothetical protein
MANPVTVRAGIPRKPVRMAHPAFRYGDVVTLRRINAPPSLLYMVVTSRWPLLDLMVLNEARYAAHLFPTGLVIRNELAENWRRVE